MNGFIQISDDVYVAIDTITAVAREGDCWMVYAGEFRGIAGVEQEQVILDMVKSWNPETMRAQANMRGGTTHVHHDCCNHTINDGALLAKVREQGAV